MAETDQAGAPVLCFGNFPVALGATTRAVIVPLAPASMPLWREVRRDDKLRMYEGSRVCGIANVQWSVLPGAWSRTRTRPGSLDGPKVRQASPECRLDQGQKPCGRLLRRSVSLENASWDRAERDARWVRSVFIFTTAERPTFRAHVGLDR